MSTSSSSIIGPLLPLPPLCLWILQEGIHSAPYLSPHVSHFQCSLFGHIPSADLRRTSGPPSLCLLLPPDTSTINPPGPSLFTWWITASSQHPHAQPQHAMQTCIHHTWGDDSRAEKKPILENAQYKVEVGSIGGGRNVQCAFGVSCLNWLWCHVLLLVPYLTFRAGGVIKGLNNCPWKPPSVCHSIAEPCCLLKRVKILQHPKSVALS